MAKRTWAESSAAEQSGSSSAAADHAARISAHSLQRQRDDFMWANGAAQHAAEGPGVHALIGAEQRVPTISRRVRACAACRKQKIKCIMDDRGPPCRRCEEKGLGCVLNKSLQALLNERLPPTDALIQDLETVHHSVQAVLKQLGLPAMPPLQSARQPPAAHTPASDEPGGGDPHHHHPSHHDDDHDDDRHHPPQLDDDVGPSCDNSPRIGPEDDHDLPKVPIHSVYHLTKLSALRSPEAAEPRAAAAAAPDAAAAGGRHRHRHGSSSRAEAADDDDDDFIARGVLPLADAERLFHLYTNRLDHFFYRVGGVYPTLDALRRASRLLAAALLTVAALHDRQSSTALYGICSREFRRLMAASIFDRRIDRDAVRAMCVASYWLSDISWLVSGIAVRRAAELSLASQYGRLIAEHSDEAADCVRLWYLLYICDQHLSTLYGRQCVMPEDAAILGWEAFLQSPLATDTDARLISQVALLNIIHNIRELFGPDAGEPMPKVYLSQMNSFSRQLDQWVGHWSTVLQEHHAQIGGFPRKGVMLHYHFAKLHLHAHVFRGLRNAALPQHFLGPATAAVTAATAIIEFLCTDADLQAALVGMPSYLHSMTAFACMFLAKLSMIHGDGLVEKTRVLDLTSRLIVLYRSTSVGKWHLVHLMANGLEKIAQTLRNAVSSSSSLSSSSSSSLSAPHVVSTQPASAAPSLAPHLQIQQQQPQADFGTFGAAADGGGAWPDFDPNFLLSSDMSVDMLHFMSFGNDPFGTSPPNHPEFMQ